MEIGGIDLDTDMPRRAIANLFHDAWSGMMIQCHNDDAAILYDRRLPLPDGDFFLYRDQAAYERATEGRDDDSYEGMIYVVNGSVVYHHNTPFDVAQVIGRIPRCPD